MILKLLGWLPIIAAFVAVDWYQIARRKSKINHLVEFIMRAGCAIIYGGLAFDAQPGWHGFHVISFEAMSFWVIFEHALNLARGRAWNYLGTTAVTDRYFSDNRAVYYILKLAAVGVLSINIHYLITNS
jgi:hypothetical protein